MTQILFENGASVSLGAISKEENLKPIGRIRIVPLPADGRCQVCGRHISELAPFGGPGDPLAGDFTGRLLVQIFRPYGPYNEAAERAVDEAVKEDPEDLADWLISRFGEEKGNHLFFSWMAPRMHIWSWECRDCAGLGEGEHFEALEKQQEREQEQIDGRIGCSGEDA